MINPAQNPFQHCHCHCHIGLEMKLSWQPIVIKRGSKKRVAAVCESYGEDLVEDKGFWGGVGAEGLYCQKAKRHFKWGNWMNRRASVSLMREAGPSSQLPWRMLCQVAMVMTDSFGQAALWSHQNRKGGQFPGSPFYPDCEMAVNASLFSCRKTGFSL